MIISNICDLHVYQLDKDYKMIPADVIINIFSFIGIGRRGHCVAYTRSYRVCRKKVPRHRALCSHHCKTFEKECVKYGRLMALVRLSARIHKSKRREVC